MVGITTGQDPNVQRDAGVVGQRLEDVAGQRPDVGPADDNELLPGRLPCVDAVGAPGDIDDGLDQRLVQRHRRVTEAADPALVPQRLTERITEAFAPGVSRLEADPATPTGTKTLSKGDKVTIIRKGQNWMKVEVKSGARTGQSGWILNKFYTDD